MNLFKSCPGGIKQVEESALEYAGTPKLELFIEANGWTGKEAEYVRNYTLKTDDPT